MKTAVETWHGTLNGYTTRACRCAECSAVAAEYRANYYAANRKKAAERKAIYYAKNRDWLVERARDAKYNLAPGQFDAMVLAQDNKCAICDSGFTAESKPHVDHDHACCSGWKSCGACIRGLLCRACNRALGILEDDVARVRRAAAYLERAK